VWTGAQAADLGLVDELGGLRTAVRKAKVAAGLDPDADVALVPYPRPRQLAEQLNEALRRVAVAAAPVLPVPRLARLAAEWLSTVPSGAPVLLPPVAFDIH
jgi:protease-4